MKLQSISLIAAICLVATAAASPVPKEEKRVAKPHNDKRAPRHIKRNALGKRGEYEDKYDYDDYYYSEYDDYYYDSYDSYDYDDYYYSDYDDYSYGKKGYKRNAAPKPVPHSMHFYDMMTFFHEMILI
ncbi:hypothetical protein F8M41_008850 [Gigaspora margarita]|uniref:Uncharacterized protein n=1 Tax=Gigaspora margarita TaxID=4874 RepID=A0A8H4AVE2_GIGMA|nr:hypothetical protein F8M41_008850 [Gigaspora margarita]